MKLVKALVTEVLLASIAVFSVASSVQAQATVAIDLFVCTMFDGNGALVVTTTNTHAVITNNIPMAGEGKLTCQATVTPSLSGRAVIWDFQNTGVLCFTPSGFTQSWHEVVSAKGEATLQCHTNPGNP